MTDRDELEDDMAALHSLPAWGTDDLPEPLPYTLRNVFRTIGPGAILLAGSIGGGEWLAGPAAAVQYGTGVFWIATVAIILQCLFNLEGIRYTLYTGEPIMTGIMRLRPGSRVWGTFYSVLAIAQLGVPALSAGCATVLFASVAGRMPGAPDAGVELMITYGVILGSVLLLLFGGTIERMLEWASWAMIVFIFGFLLVVNVWFVPAEHWFHTFSGFFQFGTIPADANWMLLAALAATAGSGGIGNLGISNWVRDKGMGMGGKVGAIASAFGSQEVKLSHVGKVFPLTPDNLRRWGLWWKYVAADQIWLWALGCFVGMFLNINLATAVIPTGTSLQGYGAGAFQAQYLAQHLWSGFWFLGLMNGFWILFSTHLGNTDILVRTLTDIVWVGSSRVRQSKTIRISQIYYAILFVLTVFGMLAVSQSTTMPLFTLIATFAGLLLSIAAIQVLIVNTTLLPAALQPSWWRKGALVACAVFYAMTTGMVIWTKLQEFGAG